MSNKKPSLYGVQHSNRKASALWGKNQFNSSFPTALVCYMRDQNIKPVYLTLDEDLKVQASEISVDDLFNTTRPNHELKFEFEHKYKPYQAYAHNDIGCIDLVVKHLHDDDETAWRRALEVKLTVIPDNTTCKRAEAEWSSELVIRPASTKYCALGMIDSCIQEREKIRQLFDKVCGTFQLWNSYHEVTEKRDEIVDAIVTFQKQFRDHQKPFLMQPVWKTQGKAPALHENAFDVFVWSDFALCSTFVDKAKEVDKKSGINRYMRSCARLARVLYTLSAGKADLNQIYTDMAYSKQTDKEFALPGTATIKYLNSPRRIKPILPRTVVTDIILDGGEKFLSPERRFDASVYFTATEIFEVKSGQLESELEHKTTSTS